MREEQHAINTTLKSAYVKQNQAFYIWEKSRSPRYEFLALKGESG